MTLLLPSFTSARFADIAQARDRVYCADAVELLRSLPDASVDAVITDPPYGIGYASSRTTRTNGELRITPSSFGEDIVSTDWLIEAYRVTKAGGCLYCFTRWDVAHIWRDAINAAGFVTVQRIVWAKAHWKMGDLRYYGSQTEDVLFARKGEHVMRWDKRQGNIWYSADALYQGDGYQSHPTQKPLRIMRRPIANSTLPGDTILDPFAGSGTTLVAARNLGRHYIGCDISAEYVAIAQRRLAAPYTLPMFTEEAV